MDWWNPETLGRLALNTPWGYGMAGGRVGGRVGACDTIYPPARQLWDQDRGLTGIQCIGGAVSLPYVPTQTELSNSPSTLPPIGGEGKEEENGGEIKGFGSAGGFAASLLGPGEKQVATFASESLEP